MTAARLWFCDHHPIPLPPGHKFPTEKYALLRQLLSTDRAFYFQPADAATLDCIACAHDRDYIQRMVHGDVAPAIMRRIGFPWSEDLVRRTLASVGGTLCATEDALAKGWGGNLAGGTHHAFRDCGAGFCVFNDVAIAFETFRAAGRIRRAAVLDLDVHQGDGTAAFFENEPGVFTVSLHAQNNFPFRKQRSSIDVALPDETGNAEFLSALDTVLEPLREFRPDLLFYQSGVDGLAEDRLGRLALSPHGLIDRDARVFNFCRAAGIPVVVTLGGGYGDPILLTAEAHANTFRTALQVFQLSNPD